MGQVLVALTVRVDGWDLVADPLGWLLVVAGVLALPASVPSRRSLVAVSVLGLLASLVLLVPAARDDLGLGVQWALNLPQLAFGYLLCTSLAAVTGAAGRGFRFLRWVFVALAPAPLLVLGGDALGGADTLSGPDALGGADALVPLLAVVAVGAVVYFVYLLFKVSRHELATQ
jgi:hypothetical protein